MASARLGITTALVLTLTGCSGPDTRRQVNASPTRAPSVSSSPLEDDIGGTYSPGPPLATVPTDALTTAAAFAAAWARPTLPVETWWTGIEQMCETSLAARFRTTDPANVPATAITGPPTPTAPATADTAHLAVPTDAGTLKLVMIRTSAGWRVAGVDFAASVR